MTKTHMKTLLPSLAATGLVCASLLAWASPAAAADRVFFEAPADGAVVHSPVQLKFGVEGYKVVPAGALDDHTGHHHVIVDGEPVPVGVVVPADATHIHYGKAQTTAELPLSPGKHTLTMQFGDGAHRSLGPAMSSTIHITVE
jgi:hypothetical protein